MSERAAYAEDMDGDEARSIAEAELAELRQVTYSELVERLLGKQETFERLGGSGTRYQVEIQAFWDDEKRGHLRVCAGVDDGGWRAFAPLGSDFIRAPDGSFIGE